MPNDSAARQSWPRQDDITPHPLVQAVAEALAADHADCDAESCCQRNSGPDWVEAHKALAAVNDAGYVIWQGVDESEDTWG